MPVASKEEKKYAYTAVIEQLREMMRGGDLAPGDRLPPERKLAEAFGVSRNSLRQAFQALAERRIIESRQGDGTYLLATVDSALSADVIVDTINEQRGFLHDIIEFRRIMEPQIAALAAQRVTPETLVRLKILVCDQQRALIAGRDSGGFDAEFHQLLTISTGNRVIGQVMSAVQAIVDESRSVWLQSSERRRVSMEGHLRIIDALEAGDASAARVAMQEHIAAIEQHIFNEQQERQ